MEALVEYLIKADFFIKMQNKSLRDFFFSIVLEAYGLCWFICKRYIMQRISEAEMFLIRCLLSLVYQKIPRMLTVEFVREGTGGFLDGVDS